MWANLFWGHYFIDQSETGNPRVEIGMALTVLLISTIAYITLNDWD